MLKFKDRILTSHSRCCAENSTGGWVEMRRKGRVRNSRSAKEGSNSGHLEGGFL